MAELGADVAIVTVRAQADQIAALIEQHLGHDVTIDVDFDSVRMRVWCRRQDPQLEREARVLFERITVGLGPISLFVVSGPRLRSV